MKSTFLIASLAAGAIALPSDIHTVHQRRSPMQNARFERRSTVNADTKIPFQIALKQNQLQQAEDQLYDMQVLAVQSDEDVVKMFAADDQSIETIKQWLISHGISEKNIHVNPTKTWITVDTTAGLVEKALKTRYHIYRSRASGQDHIGSEEYSLPNSLLDIVDYVRPGPSLTKVTVRDGKPAKAPAAIHEPVRKLSQDELRDLENAIKSGPSGSGDSHDAANSTLPPYLQICSNYVTPDCIAYLYKIPKAEGTNSTNRLGIYESLGDVYSQEDLDLFYKNAAPYIPAGTGPQLDLINGATAPNSPDKAGGESLLDFDMAYPIIYPQGTTLFQVKEDQYDNIFGDFLSAIDSDYCSQDPYWNNHKMCGTFEPTNVVSISYGGPEDPTDPKAAHRQCNEFMKLGLMGITTVVASGDAGVTDRAGYCLGPHHDIFVADDLCSCPYITAVGSTLIHSIDKPESATESFSSGGGFSNIFTRPKWQDNVVSHYLLRHNPGYFAYNTSEGNIPDNAGIYNRGGRGFPDVSAVGDNGVVAVGGRIGRSGGTSMSAPIVAAILNRINEKRLSLGKGPIGFANPALYAMAQYAGTFNDVTIGDQALGGVASDRGYSACGNNGFSAVEGWDPVTGLGTPVYDQWEKFFLQI
ncbi:alkaline serine protease AorO [Cordyceps javanica]|uniref:Alkaline serine protease AorO n=1 Tax=Cordyceps javanica TaxID=43265 RepID=A0A545VX38_9HYPO|nr:alkaline serine protease AorO [Cordyceps javanica]TQW06291.1 alkaline serine protease AorO [Cordyceps javanica]